MERFDPQKFAEEYAERLRAAEEYRPPALFLPGGQQANMGYEFSRVRDNILRGNPDATGYGTPGGFMRRYQEEYFPEAQRVAQKANIPTISEQVDEFVAKTGLKDPRARDQGFFDLERAKHELVSHMQPYKAGFMPDYRNLPAAMTGMPDFTSNPVSPLNERFASNLDFMIQDNPLPGSPTKRNFTRARVKNLFEGSGFETSLEKSLRQQALDAGKPFAEVEPAVHEFMLRNYPETAGRQISDSVADEIVDQLNKKYLPGAKYDFKQKGDLFYPTGGTFGQYFNNREGFQRFLMGSTAEGVDDAARKFSSPGTNYMMTAVPFLSPDALDAKALSKGAQLSAVDLIPSREAVRDFAKGDVKQGVTRMAQEYVQGLPVAMAAGAGLSSLPAQAAAVANPVGAGVAGGFALTRAAEALDEATKQQTGEGLLDKFQQTVNKIAGPGFGRPTTGSAYRGSERADEKRARIEREGSQALENLVRLNRGEITFDDLPAPPVAQLGQGTRETSPVPQNELQRRFRLAQQRFNPSRGEFGFTELLGGK